MSNTTRNGENGKKVRDGKFSSPAHISVRTDGDRLIPDECYDTPADHDPKFKREVKRIAHKKVRNAAKRAMTEEETDL